MISAKRIADTLNQLFALDPGVAAALVGHRVKCGDVLLADDVPFVCSRGESGTAQIGMLGVLNAMASRGTGRAAAVYDCGRLTGFIVTGSPVCEPYQFENYLS